MRLAVEDESSWLTSPDGMVANSRRRGALDATPLRLDSPEGRRFGEKQTIEMTTMKAQVGRGGVRRSSSLRVLGSGLVMEHILGK